MKLTDIGTKPHYSKMNQIFESRFGFRVNFDTMTVNKAQRIAKSLTEAINVIKLSSKIHTSEKNPRYTELLMVRESLVNWIKEKRRITEGEVGQAEALLAAKDIVDSIQDMIEKVGKIQNEQLPALLDTIRDQIGSAEADAFKSTIGQTLAGIATLLTSSRDQADSGVRALSGENAMTDMSMGGGQPNPAMQGAADTSMPSFDQGGDSDGFGASDAAAGGNDSAGRELR